MFAKLSYYAHSAQDKLGNLLPYEHWQTLQSHSVNVGEMAAEFARVYKWHIRVLAEMYWFEFTTKTSFNILILFL